MIAEKLRKAVLQAAMEGKLTEQLESDGSALDLVTDAKQIKESLNDKLVPINWIVTTISNVGDVIGGGTPKTTIKEYWNGNIPWITPADMSNKEGIYISHGKRFITQKGLNKSSARLLPKGSILLSSRAPIGYVAIASNPIATNQGFKSIVPNNLEMNKYIYYCLMSIVNELQELGTGTTFKEISGATLKKVLIPIPPLAEQKRIVEKLEVLLAEIDKLEEDEKALKDLEDKFPEKLKNAIMLSAIQGNLSQRITTKEESSILKKKILDKKEELIKNNIIRKEKQYPIEENEVFIIPDEWESIELGDIVHFTKMIKKKTADKLPYLDVKSLRTNEYNNFRTNGEAVEAGDYAILVDGQNSGEIFKISKKGFLGSTLRKIVINPIIEHNYALLILDFYKNTFRDNKRGAAIPHLDFKIFNTSIVPLPSSIEQKHIIEKLDKIFAVDLLNI